MGKKRIIGIMGPGEGATPSDLEMAFEIGKALAEIGFQILTGGRASGVMEAAMKGAKSADGTTIGILPTEDGSDASQYVDISIKTGMGSARNNINILTADIVVAIGFGAGTTSEIALAVKAQKTVLLINWTDEAKTYFSSFGYANLHFCTEMNEILSLIKSSLI